MRRKTVIALLAGLVLVGAGCKTLRDNLPPIKIEIPSGVPTPTPKPDPSPEPEEPSPFPSPTPKPSPSPEEPSPFPSPSPSPQSCSVMRCASGCCQDGQCVPCPPPTPEPPLCEAKKRPDRRECSLCSEHLEQEVRHGHLKRDAQGRLYNDPGNDASRRYYIDRECSKVDAQGKVLTRHFWGIWPNGIECPACPTPPPASPPPSTPPTTSDDQTACTLAPGALNWPLVPGTDKQRSEGGFCPACWGDHPEQIVSRCGIRHIRTAIRNGGAGRLYRFDVTCHSDAPRCPHRPDQRTCDVLWGCQPPEPALYQTGPGFELERVDRQSDNPYFGQIHISDPRENGWYTIYACPPGIRPDGPNGDVCESLYLYVGTDGELFP